MSASSGRGRPRRSASSSPSGLQLDANDPTDARIIARQVGVARRAGRDGLDRAAATRGRADLEAAYDQGVAEGGGQGSSAPTGRRGKGGGKSTSGSPVSTPSPSISSVGPTWQQMRPTSPAKLPTRVADAGGFITGLALYTVVIIYIRYGAEGWKGWLKAKFLNQPMKSASTGSSATEKPKSQKGGSLAV